MFSLLLKDLISDFYSAYQLHLISIKFVKQQIMKKKQTNAFARWVGIKESGRLKPALLDSGRPRTGLLSSGIVYTMQN